MQEPETLSWLLNNKNETALATNRFRENRKCHQSSEKTLCGRGEAGRGGRDVRRALENRRRGGSDADGIDATFPKEKSKEILRVIRSLRPSGWHEADYNSYEREIEGDPAPSQTIHLWWE